MPVKEGDGALDPLWHILYGGKIPSVEEVYAEDAEPDVDRVEPTTVPGRGDKADALLWITHIRLPGLHALEHAPFSFCASDVPVTRSLSIEAHQRPALPGGALVTHDDEACPGVSLDLAVLCAQHSVSSSPAVSNRCGDAFARSTVASAGQHTCAVPDVVELAVFYLACPGWYDCPIPFTPSFCGCPAPAAPHKRVRWWFSGPRHGLPNHHLTL